MKETAVNTAGHTKDTATGDNAAGLTAEQVAFHRANGYVFPFRAMDKADAAGYRARIEAFEAEHKENAAQILRQKSHLVLSFVAELVRLEPVLDKVQSLLGPDILCWSTSFFIKDSGDKQFVSWHQDAQYWGLEGDDMVTAWVALTPSNISNGCMRVVPRSHLQVLEHRDTHNKGNMLTRGQEIAAEVNESQAVDLCLEAGQFSLHHERTVHGSKDNHSADRRIGLAIRYIHPAARQVVESRDTATLVRGVDRYGHFGEEPRPRFDMDPVAVEYLEQLLSKRAGGSYRRKT